MKRAAIVAAAVGSLAALWFGGWIAYDSFDLWATFSPTEFQNLLGVVMGADVLLFAVASYRVQQGPASAVVNDPKEDPPTDHKVYEKTSALETRVENVDDRVKDLEIAKRLVPAQKDKLPETPEKLPNKEKAK